MGIGWALNFPSVEIISTIKYLHLPDGSKFKIKSDNMLDGYKLSDISFGTATGSDFTSNGVSAAYYLWSKDETKAYFDTNGRYLGSKDILGNATQVYYNADNSFDKIYEPSGRYVKFNYSSGSGTKTVTIQLVDIAAKGSTAYTLYTITENQDATTSKYYLSQITDAVSRTSQFSYGNYDSSVIFNYNSDIASVTEIKNKSIYLSQVTSPTGAVTHFDYSSAWKQYGYASDRMYKQLADTYVTSGGTNYNNSTFNYYYQVSGNNTTTNSTYWMYSQNAIFPYAASNYNGYTTMTYGNSREDFSYDYNKYAISTFNYDYVNSIYVLSNSNQIVSSDSNLGLPTEVDTLTYNSGSTSTYTISKNTHTWDSYGNATKSQTQSGDNNSMNSYIDSKTINIYGTSLVIPQTEVQYSFFDVNNNLGNGYVYYGTVYSRNINASTILGEAINSDFQSLKIYNLNAKKINGGQPT
jgi:hypothetical protein